jgi:hypothetical protein
LHAQYLSPPSNGESEQKQLGLGWVFSGGHPGEGDGDGSGVGVGVGVVPPQGTKEISRQRYSNPVSGTMQLIEE